MLVFTSSEVELDVVESPLSAIKIKQLKEFMRQEAKKRKLGMGELAKLNHALTNA